MTVNLLTKIILLKQNFYQIKNFLKNLSLIIDAVQLILLYTKENIEVEERAAFSTDSSKPQLSNPSPKKGKSIKSLKLRITMGNVSKRQQTDHRADNIVLLRHSPLDHQDSLQFVNHIERPI